MWIVGLYGLLLVTVAACAPERQIREHRVDTALDAAYDQQDRGLKESTYATGPVCESEAIVQAFFSSSRWGVATLACSQTCTTSCMGHGLSQMCTWPHFRHHHDTIPIFSSEKSAERKNDMCMDCMGLHGAWWSWIHVGGANIILAYVLHGNDMVWLGPTRRYLQSIC